MGNYSCKLELWSPLVSWSCGPLTWAWSFRPPMVGHNSTSFWWKRLEHGGLPDVGQHWLHSTVSSLEVPSCAWQSLCLLCWGQSFCYLQILVLEDQLSGMDLPPHLRLSSGPYSTGGHGYPGLDVEPFQLPVTKMFSIIFLSLFYSHSILSSMP